MNYITGLGIKSREDEKSNKENYCFSTELSDDSCIMGVFVGYKGDKVRRFLVENFPKEVKEVMKNAAAEADIPSLLTKVFENMENKVILLQEKSSNNYKENLDCSTGVVIYLKNEWMHVANLGCNRALLCTEQGKTPIQLTEDHSFQNPKESARLTRLGLDTSKWKDFHSMPFSRCFGGRGLAKHFNCPHDKSPWTAEPGIKGPYKLDEGVRLLVITTKSVLEKLGDEINEQTNINLVSKIEQNLLMSVCMNSVAQKILEQEPFTNDTQTAQKPGKFSQDPSYNRLLLLIHNFQNAFAAVDNSYSDSQPLSIDVSCEQNNYDQSFVEISSNQDKCDNHHENKDLGKSTARTPDNNGKRIKAYVNFTGFDETVANLPDDLKKDYEVIMKFMNS